MSTGGNSAGWNLTGGNMLNGWYIGDLGNLNAGGITMVGDSLKEGESEEEKEEKSES